MKAGWGIKPLGQVCRLINGRAYKQAELLESGPYPVLRVGNFFTNNHWYYSDLELDADKYCDDGDLLYAWSASFGPRIWQGGKVIYHYHIWKVEADRAQLDRDFLYYFFDWDKELIKKDQGAGTTMIHVSKGSMEARPIPLPPLDEQKRIVAVLDEAFEGLSRARANAEANLADAREVMLNYLRQVFTDCERSSPPRRIGEIADHCLGKMLDKNKNQGMPRLYLRNINVRWFEVDTSDMLEMRIEDREVERYSAKKGDLLICEGGYPGRAAVWDAEDPVFFQKALHRVRFSNPAYAEFLMYYLFMKDASGQLKNSFTGSGIQHFTGQALAQFTMPFPDSTTSTRIVEQIETIRASTSELERQYQASISQLDTLRQSLLQKAFSGELT